MPLMRHLDKEPRMDSTCFVADDARVIGNVTLGKDSSVWFGAVLRADINAIVIGERTNIQDGCILHVTHEHPVRVGSDVTIGHRAIVHGCTVGDGSLIGMGAAVLDGATVGAHALVAAGSVVREGFIVPEGTVVAGVPARVVRLLTDEERQRILQSAQNYVNYGRTYHR